MQAEVVTALAHQDCEWPRQPTLQTHVRGLLFLTLLAMIDNTLSRFEWPTTNPDYTKRIPTHGRAAMDVDEPDRESDWEDDQADDPNSKLVSTVGMHAPPRFTMQSVPIKYKSVRHLAASPLNQLLFLTTDHLRRFVFLASSRRGRRRC